MEDGYNFSNIEADFKKFISSGNKNLGKNTVKNYISDLRHFLGWYHLTYKSSQQELIPASNASYFDHLDTDSVKAYISYLESADTSPLTIKRRTSSLSGFLKYLVSHDLITDNYLKTIRDEEKRAALLESLGPEPAQSTAIESVDLLQQPKPAVRFQKASIVSHIKSRPLIFGAIGTFAFLALIINFTPLGARGSQPNNNPFVSATSNGDARVLTFRGRLTDSLGNPISKKTDVRFKLYRSPVGTSAVFESNACTIIPDVEGNFEVAIGSSERDINTIGCDKKIPASLFGSTTPLYLGVTVGTNAEMKPRKQISNVGLADDALRLNGAVLGAGTNGIPYINEKGEISLSAESPEINAGSVSDNFKITSSKALILQTASDGDITLAATESGRIRFITSGTEIERMVIAQNGNVGIGTAVPGFFKLEVSGSVGPSITKTYNLGAADRLWNTLYVNRICFDSEEKFCTTGLDPLSSNQTAATASGSSTLSGDLLVGGTATASANIKLSASSGNHSFIRTGYLGINTTAPSSALDVVGSANFSGNTVDITSSSGEDLTLRAGGDGIIDLDDHTHVGGNFAAGTDVISGTTVIDIGGTATAHALCHSSQSGTDNQQIVDCSSTPTADFAEMYPVAQGTDYGDVMSLGPKEVQTTTGDYIRELVHATAQNNRHVIGVVSNNYSDFISVGHNLKVEDNPKPIALKGRVPVKIASSSKSIKAGDYLTSSTEPGKASKATKPGIIIGRALEDWTPLTGKNQIMVFVGTGYADPGVENSSLVEILQETIGLIQSPIVFNQKIISPIVETDSIVTREITASVIKPKEKNLKIDLSKESTDSSELAKISVSGRNGTEAASIDAAGNATFSGTLSAKDATVAGTLVAENIDARNIRELEERLAAAVKSSTYNEDINEIQSVLGDLKNAKLPNPSRYTPVPEGLYASETMTELLDSLTVMGDTNLFRLNVHDKIFTLKDELQISALASVNFMDGAIVMSREGNITTKGTVTAKEVKAKKFSVFNDENRETARIEASGAATFATLNLPAEQNNATPSAVIAAARNYVENGLLMPAIESRSDSAGVGVVPANESEIAVYNDSLKRGSLIFLTQQNSTSSAGLSVSRKETCDSQADCKPYFSVSAGSNSHQDIYFSWFILNNR